MHKLNNDRGGDSLYFGSLCKFSESNDRRIVHSKIEGGALLSLKQMALRPKPEKSEKNNKRKE